MNKKLILVLIIAVALVGTLAFAMHSKKAAQLKKPAQFTLEDMPALPHMGEVNRPSAEQTAEMLAKKGLTPGDLPRMAELSKETAVPVPAEAMARHLLPGGTILDELPLTYCRIMVHDVATCCYYHPNGEDPLWGWPDPVYMKVWNDPQYDPENSACGYPIYPFEVDYVEFELFVPEACKVIGSVDIEDFIWDHCSPYPSWPPIAEMGPYLYDIPEGGFWYLGATFDPPVCVYDRFFASFTFYNSMDFDPTCYEGPPPYHVFDYELGLQEPPPPDSSVQWHQIWRPAWHCESWHQDGWEDNGDGILSECDYLYMSLKPQRCVQRKYHIEKVTRTLTLTLKPELIDTFYLDEEAPTGPYWEPIDGTVAMGTPWHVVWPESLHCQIWILTSWEDNNGNGYIDFCDQIDFETLEGTEWFHVEKVSTNITVVDAESCETDEGLPGHYNQDVPYHFAGSAIFDQGGLVERTYWSFDGWPTINQWWDGLIWWPGAIRLWAYGYTADQNECPVTEYWWQKEPFEEYAPCGIPDFDQKGKEAEHPAIGPFDGPTALANCLWWMAAAEIIDPFWDDSDGDGDNWDPDEPPYLINLLAQYMNLGDCGVDPYQMNEALSQIHDDYIMWFTHTHLQPPTWEEIEYNLRLSQDVILLLGFWYEDPPGSGEWWRIGGHWVTAAGVDHVTGQLKISDPDLDAAELFGNGFVCSLGRYLPHDHVADPLCHYDAGNASHDVYTVAPSPSPGGLLALFDYPYWDLGIGGPEQGLEKYFGHNVKPEFVPFQAPIWDPTEPIYVEIEAAKVLCPEIPMTSSRIQMTYNNHGSYYDFNWDMDGDGFFDIAAGYQACLVLGTYPPDNLATDYGSTDEGAWYTNVQDWQTDALYFTGPSGDHRFVRNYCIFDHNTLPLQIEWWIVGDFDPTGGACEDAVFVKYVITNTGEELIEDIEKALYFDWDVIDAGNNAVDGEETFSSMWIFDVDYANYIIGVTQKPVYEDKPNSYGGFGVSQPTWIWPNEGWLHDELKAIMQLGTWQMDPLGTQPEDAGMLLTDNPFDLAPGESYCNEYILWAYDKNAPIDALPFGQFLYALMQQDGYFRGDVADRGDGYADGICNIDDIVYMIDYVLKSGPAPVPFDDQGDVNCDGEANITDIVYLIDYLLKNGPYPIDKNRFFFDDQPYELMFSRESLFADPVWKDLYYYTF
jgi:hypothetical protein